MGYVGLIVGAVVGTLLVPRAAAEAYRLSRSKIEKIRTRRAETGG